MSVDIDEHNKRIDRIIADEIETLGLDCDVGRMMRADVDSLLRLVAGHASAMELRVQAMAVERECMIDKIEKLEAVS